MIQYNTLNNQSAFEATAMETAKKKLVLRYGVLSAELELCIEEERKKTILQEQGGIRDKLQMTHGAIMREATHLALRK